MKAARQAKNQLNRIGCTIIGAILNGISHSRGYYPYYYGYYRYYAYKYSYDEDRKSLFSMREFGLRIESKFKEIIQSVRLSLPRWVASSQSIMRHLLRRKIFWLLLCLSLGLAVLNNEKKHFSPGSHEKEAITYLGEATANSLKAPNPVVDSNREAGVSSTDRREDLTLSALKDSLKIWQDAYNEKDFARFIGFYDSIGFQFPGGNFASWATETNNNLLRASSRYSIIHLDSVWTDTTAPPFYKTSVIAKKISSGDTAFTYITFLWKNNNNCWRIIREKQRVR
jgi:hypothetical protein